MESEILRGLEPTMLDNLMHMQEYYSRKTGRPWSLEDVYAFEVGLPEED